MAPAPRRVGDRGRASAEPAVGGGDHGRPAAPGPRLRARLLVLPGQHPGQRPGQRALRAHLRLRQRRALRGRESAPRSRDAPGPLPQPSRARRGPRGLLQPAARPVAGRALGRGDRRPARGLARPVSRAGRAARGEPRPRLRESRRGGGGLQPASPLPDLRHQLRVQDHRERGSGGRARIGPRRGACCSRTSWPRSGRTAAAC